MYVLKMILTFIDVAFAMMMYFFQREEKVRVTKIGACFMILLICANAVLIWR